MAELPTNPTPPSLSPEPSVSPKPNSRFVMPPWLNRKTVVPLAGLALLVGVLGMGTYLVQQNQNLGTSARKKETHVSPRVIELSDNFDGTSLDTTAWRIAAGNPPGTVQQALGGFNATVQPPPPSAVLNSTGIATNTMVAGNFTAEVQVLALQVAAPNSGSAELALINADSSASINLAWRKNSPGSYIDLNTTASPGSPPQFIGRHEVGAVDSLRLRLVREGSTAHGFVDTGSGFALVASLSNAFSGEGVIAVQSFTFSDSTEFVSATFDNFSSRSTLAMSEAQTGVGIEEEREEQRGEENKHETAMAEEIKESVGGEIETAASLTCSQAAFSDTFAQEIRTEQWQKMQPDGASVARSGEQVVITVPKGNSDNAGRLSTKRLISGDFQIEVDVLSLQSSGGNTGANAELTLEGESLGQVHIARRKGANYDTLETNARRPDRTWGGSVTIDASGMGPLRFRIVRLGQTLRTYYKRVGNDFVQLGEFSGIYSGEGWAQLMAFSLVDHPAVNATFDNFSLRCPESVAIESDAETSEEHETIVQASPTTEFGGLSGPLRSETSVVASARPETGGESVRGGEQRGQSQFVPESGSGVRASERPRSSSAPESGRNEARGQERRGIVERVKEFFSNILGIFRGH